MVGTRELLNEREARYGNFKDHSYIAQNIKEAMICTANWPHLSCSQRESLEMIAHKIARIMNGDVNYADNWVDIAGYAQLIADELEVPDQRQEMAEQETYMYSEFDIDKDPPF